MRFRLTGASARSDPTPRTDNPAVDDCERKLSNLTSAAHSSRAHLHAYFTAWGPLNSSLSLAPSARIALRTSGSKMLSFTSSPDLF